MEGVVSLEGTIRQAFFSLSKLEQEVLSEEYSLALNERSWGCTAPLSEPGKRKIQTKALRKLMGISPSQD